MCVCVCLAGFLWIAQHLKRNAFYGLRSWGLVSLGAVTDLDPNDIRLLNTPLKKISNGSATNQIIQYSLSNHWNRETLSGFQIEQIHQQRQLWLWHWDVCLYLSRCLSLASSDMTSAPDNDDNYLPNNEQQLVTCSMTRHSDYPQQLRINSPSWVQVEARKLQVYT